MARHRRRKCRHCGQLFEPDPRNRYHQRFCSQAACRKASKATSQRRWFHTRGRDYYKGPVNVDRVHRWRQQHPRYWRRRGDKPKSALQDLLLAQPVRGKAVKPVLKEPALQDLLIRQALVLTGLIAHLNADALQDDMDSMIRSFIAAGRRLLEQGISLHDLVGGLAREFQTPAVSRASAPGPSSVQLDRSPPGS